MSTRTRHYGVYSYPGLLFADTTTRDIETPTAFSAVASGPADSRWYAVDIHTVIEKKFLSDDGEETWVKKSDKRVARIVVGEKIHVDNIPDTDQNRILRDNIRWNSKDGYGVKTRAGNWQIASDYDVVLNPSLAGGA